MATVVGVDDAAKKRITCRNCASIIEYVPRDLKSWVTSCCGERGNATGFDCPACGHVIVTAST